LDIQGALEIPSLRYKLEIEKFSLHDLNVTGKGYFTNVNMWNWKYLSELEIAVGDFNLTVSDKNLEVYLDICHDTFVGAINEFAIPYAINKF
jgi:hypothetical protein